jgi:hypothetical protein
MINCIYKGKKVKILKLAVTNKECIKYLLIMQVTIEYKDADGDLCSSIVEGYEVEFIY